jgi:hypothetical protein
MLSTIKTHWPPIDGDPEVGHKTVQFLFTATHTETLMGLHEPAWWTGCRIRTQDEREPFQVELLCREGTSIGTLQVENGAWTPFPWPIPAMMANRLGLKLRISSMKDTPSHISIRIGFQEMTSMPIRDLYLFTDPNGFPVIQWTGDEVATAYRDSGDWSKPKAGYLYRVVPPMARLLGAPWYNLRVQGVNSWSSCLIDPL